MKIRVLILLFLAFIQISNLHAQSDNIDSEQYVGEEWIPKTINIESYYKISSIEFTINESDYSAFLKLETREHNKERDFVITPTQYFSGVASVTLTIHGKRTADGDNRELFGKTWTIKCKDNPLHISPENMTLSIGGKNKIIDYFHDKREYETAAVVSFHPESTIVYITDDGSVMPLLSGETSIKVQSNLSKDYKYCHVKVEGAPQPKSIELDPRNLTMTVNKKDTLTAFIEPEGAEFTSIDWDITGNKESVTVKKIDKTTAVVTAKGQGNATITATISDTNLKASCPVSVTTTSIEPNGIVLNKNTMMLTVEDQDTLSATVTPANADFSAIDWKSSNEDALIVTRIGKTTALVTAVGKGTAIITAMIKNTNLESSCQVTVSPLVPERIKLNQHSQTIEAGSKKTLIATVTPVDAEYKINWTTSNPNVASVKRRSDTRAADVTAIGKGTATIIATIEGTNMKDSCKVNVFVPPTDIDIPQVFYELIVGEEMTIIPTIEPDNADYTLSWDTNDPDVAIVMPIGETGKSGKVTAMNEGEAKIIVTIVGTGIDNTFRVIVRKPKLSVTAFPNGGVVNKGTRVVLSTNSIGAKIYYTTDGTTPDQFDHLYRTPIIINQDTKIKAIAIQEGYNNSDILTASFVIRNIPGDVNTDNEVSVADINSIISVILDNDNNQSIQWADINNDGEVTIADINAVIDIILNPKHYIQEVEPFFVNGVEFDMVYVEGGTFNMGADQDTTDVWWDPDWGPYEDPYENTYPAHEVTLYSFRIGQTEVTNKLWEAVMGTNPSTGSESNIDDPVQGISWYDCQEFIKRLNIITGKQFRLPTEAEWEYVANKIFDEDGNENNSIPVYNMSGGAHEWCIDWYGPYTNQPQMNPIGPLVGTDRVIRGSSDLWESLDVKFNFRERIYDKPDESGYYAGLRLVLSDVEIYTVNDVSFAMLPVKGGTFAMGDDHQSTVSNYSIGQTEVTQALWKAVMGDFSSEVYCDYPESPVVYWLGGYEGHGVIMGPYQGFSVFIEVLNDITGRSFRFLKDVEWEYAARGGGISQGYEYAGSDDVNEVAWYGQEFTYNTPTVIPVGSLSPNELGLYDMSGNAYEMCVINDYLSIRGGCWYSNPQECSVYWSDYLDELGLRRYGGGALGFRLALGNSANPIIELDRYHTTIKVGGTAEIEILQGNGSYRCSSDNMSVNCWIEGNKVLISGDSVGTATITVTDVNTSAIATINVNIISASTSIELDKTSLTMHKGETMMLNATIIPPNPNCKIGWLNYAPGIISTKTAGNNAIEVTALREGSTIIRALITDTDIEAESSITVSN